MKVFVSIWIYGRGLKIEEISEVLNIDPTYKYKEGDIFISIRPNGKEIQYKEDCWIGGIESQNNETVEDCIERFIKILLPSTDYIYGLSKKFNIIINVSTYPYGEQNNVHFSNNILQIISKMGASLDCTTAFLKVFYDGNYDTINPIKN